MRTRKAKHRQFRPKDPNRYGNGKTQTTLRLPRKLYEKTKMLVESRKAASVNDFIVGALSAYVRAVERKAIDDAFQGMAHDEEYQRETLRIMEEFEKSDAETIALSERDLVGI